MEPPRPFGQPRRHLRSAASTNDIARELAAGGAPTGSVVTADEQSAGRGRQGRSWVAPRGKALLCSYVLRGLDEEHSLLPLAVPLAVCEAAEEVGAPPCRVKWPNDVLVEERKLAGVLIEARPREGWAVIGVGLNVELTPEELPAELHDRAASIGGDATVAAALAALNRSLAEWTVPDPERVLEEYRSRDALRGREVSWADGEGVAEGVDEAGSLLVRTDDGPVALGAGEIHLRIGSARD